MAAPAESGYGLAEAANETTVDTAEVKRLEPKVVGDVEGGVEHEDVIDGSEACPESGEAQLAKKPRVEKPENGAADNSSAPEAEAVNGAAGGEDGVNGVEGEGNPSVEGTDKNGVKEVEAAKDAVPGDGGLRTLLHEGEDATASAGSHGEDAAHALNGAK